MSANRRAFTLVELSIVLVIVGLLVGGIMAGQNMQRASQARSVLADGTGYAIAVQHFRDKYGALPGDMPDATRFWGRADGGDINANCASPNTTESVGKLTCNGNGDGIIDYSDQPIAVNEAYRAWQHLAAAGLIEGNYVGVVTTGANDHDPTPGVHIPQGRIENTGYTLWSAFPRLKIGNQPLYYNADYANYIAFGTKIPGFNPVGPALTVSEAYAMDKKEDDGLPGMGTIITSTPSAQTTQTAVGIPVSNPCASSDIALTAVYNIGTRDVRCNLIFLQTFKRKS